MTMIGGNISGSVGIDAFRQGVSVTRLSHMRKRVTPTLRSTSDNRIVFNSKELVDSIEFNDTLLTSYMTASITELSRSYLPNNNLDALDFGQPDVYTSDPSYTEVTRYDAVNYLQDDGNDAIYPSVLSANSLEQADQKSGVIEPFVIRSAIERSTLEGDRPFRSVYGSITSFGEDNRNRSVEIVQQVNINAESPEPFEDSADVVMNATFTSGSSAIAGYFNNADYNIEAFCDTSDAELAYLDMTDVEMKKILVSGSINSLSGTLFNDSSTKNNYKSTNSGFVYRNARLGTDSLAFGGLNRKL